nr:MAG TPA: hypothetical protein [Caudoviricetes sp.]
MTRVSNSHSRNRMRNSLQLSNRLLPQLGPSPICITEWRGENLSTHNYFKLCTSKI